MVWMIVDENQNGSKIILKKHQNQQTQTTFEAKHPGTLIKDELEVRDDITQKT